MKRALVYMSALVGVGAIHAGAALAQAPAATPPAPASAPKPGGRVAVFNVAKVMRDYQKWQAFAKVMNEKRIAASGTIVKTRTDIANLQQALAAEPSATKKDEITKQLLATQRNLEDSERTLRKQLDDESAGYLKNLFVEIQTCVQAVVQANGFDLVMAYPDALTPEEMNSPMYYDLKLRPNAAMPFYISPNADMTDVLIATLNARFPAPAGATPAASPGAAPAGSPAPTPAAGSPAPAGTPAPAAQR